MFYKHLTWLHQMSLFYIQFSKTEHDWKFLLIQMLGSIKVFWFTWNIFDLRLYFEIYFTYLHCISCIFFCVNFKLVIANSLVQCLTNILFVSRFFINLLLKYLSIIYHSICLYLYLYLTIYISIPIYLYTYIPIYIYVYIK